MKLLSGLVSEISSVVDTLAVSSKEKKQIEADLVAAIARQEEALSQSQSSIIQAEAQGNWLQRSWRPIIMLVFATIVLIGTFFDLPILSDTSRFWDLLEIGIGGYVIGRSAEKITGRLKGGSHENRSPPIGRFVRGISALYQMQPFAGNHRHRCVALYRWGQCHVVGPLPGA